jgi:hypothetical protein
MSDIVERLRQQATIEAKKFGDAADIQLEWKAAAEITRLRAGLQRIVEGDGFWDAPALARDLLEGKDVK